MDHLERDAQESLQKKAAFLLQKSLHSPVGEVSSNIKVHSVGASKYHYMVMLLPFPVFHCKFVCSVSPRRREKIEVHWNY